MGLEDFRKALLRILDGVPLEGDRRLVEDYFESGQVAAPLNVSAVGGTGSINIAAESIRNSSFLMFQGGVTLRLSGQRAAKLRSLGLGKNAKVQFVPGRSRLAEALDKVLPLFAEEAENGDYTMDTNLFLAGKLDLYYRALLLALPPTEIRGLPHEELDSTVLDLRSDAVLTASYVRSAGLDKRLKDCFVFFQEVCDKYQEMMARRRQLSKERGIVHRQALQDFRKAHAQRIQGKTFSSSEAISESFDVVADISRVGKRVDLEYDGKDDLMRLEFDAFLRGSKARTKAKLLEVGSAQQWAEDACSFDEDDQIWQRVRTLTFQHDFDRRAELLRELLVRHEGGYVATMFFVHNVSAKHAAQNKEHARVAAKAALTIPKESVFDVERIALFVIAARAGLAYLKELEKGRRFGDGETTYAGYIAELWDLWKQHEPEFAPAEVLEARVYALASAGRFEEAYAAVTTKEQLGRVPELTYSVVRITSRLGRFEDSLKWLDYGLKSSGQLKLSDVRRDPDLEPLRKGRAGEFEALTSVRCEVQSAPWWAWDKVTLTNRSSFPIHDLKMQINSSDNGRLSLQQEGELAIGAACEWRLIRSRPEGSRTQPHQLGFSLTCAEGSCRG